MIKPSARLLGLLAVTVMLGQLASAQMPPATPTGTNGQAATPPFRGFGGGADQPSPRRDPNSQLAHQQLLAKAHQGGIDVYFEGDSITRRWGATDYPNFLANWNANFFGWNAADFGWGADRVENILWRLENGELDGVNPKVIVLLAGINNVGARPGGPARVADISRGIKAVLDVCQQKAPDATIILTAIFPRNDNMAVVPMINQINTNLAAFADGKKIRFLNVNDKLAASHAQRLPSLGRRLETDPDGTARSAGQDGPRARAHGRSQREERSGRAAGQPVGQSDLSREGWNCHGEGFNARREGAESQMG